MSTELIVDVTAFMLRIQADQDLALELIELFLVEAPRMLAEIQAASSQNDCARIEKIAHAVKGSVANFSALPAFEAARKLEIISRNREVSNVGDACSALSNEIARLSAELIRISKEPVSS